MKAYGMTFTVIESKDNEYTSYISKQTEEARKTHKNRASKSNPHYYKQAHPTVGLLIHGL